MVRFENLIKSVATNPSMIYLFNVRIIIEIGIFFWFTNGVIAEEECHPPQKIMCYDCESSKNPHCSDTFNTSIHAVDHVPSKSCYGCCVKIVMNQNKPDQYIRRTCTKEIAINLFMVDHVCMEESDGQGHMCFCESDFCNRAAMPKYTSIIIASNTIIALLINVVHTFQIM